ncbi:MAG: hypothetical protein R3A79_04600 [Nannocystaceae bacterium]
MATIEPAALNLRFRQRESTSAPLDLQAFLPSPRATRIEPPEAQRAAPANGPATTAVDARDAASTPTAAAPCDAPTEATLAVPRGGPPRPAPSLPPPDIGVLPGARPLDPDEPLVVLLQRPDFGIPALGAGARLPALTSWHVRPTAFGWVARVEPPRRGAAYGRVATVLAACVALAIPTAAAATPPPTAHGPALPQPAAQAPTEVEDASDDDDAQPAEPVAEPAPAPVPTSIAPTLAPTRGRDAIADAAWEGVDGFEVVLDLKGGKILQGRVGAVQEDTFTLIDTATGQVLVLAKSAVTSLRVYVPPPVPSKTGTGMLVGGGILTTVGVPIFITGVVFLGICPSCTYLHLPMLLIGGGALGGGIPMISTGVQRRNAYRRALEGARVTPLVSRTRYGWNGGLSVRF